MSEDKLGNVVASTPQPGDAVADQPKIGGTITLDSPLKRGDQLIKKITVRKPLAGALRGVSLVELAQMDVSALERVLPRITDPVLTAVEVGRLDLADIVQFGTLVAGFLLPKAEMDSPNT